MIVEHWNTIVLIGIALLLVLAIALGSRDKPLFKHKCSECGAKDKDWYVSACGHDDFAWYHRCKENKHG